MPDKPLGILRIFAHPRWPPPPLGPGPPPLTPPFSGIKKPVWTPLAGGVKTLFLAIIACATEELACLDWQEGCVEKSGGFGVEKNWRVYNGFPCRGVGGQKTLALVRHGGGGKGKPTLPHRGGRTHTGGEVA